MSLRTTYRQERSGCSMQEVEEGSRPRRRLASRTSGVAAALAVLSTVVGLAACGSSSSSSSSAASSGGSSSSSSSSGSLKTGLNVFVVPKLLGATYFTVADSAKSGGAIAALQGRGGEGDAGRGPAR